MSKYAQPARRPAVVTGASSGIGAATALVLGAQGFPVALGARRTDKCEEVAAQVRAAGGEAVVHPLDLTDHQSVSDFAKAVTTDLGDVEVLVSNAGSVGPGVIHEVDTERMRSELDVNLLGAHRLVRAFVPGMVERRRGDLVFVSSDVAVRPRPFMAAYAASKWGLEGLAQSMQMELEGTGGRASIVRPGPTWSEMGSTWNDDDAAFVLEQWVRFGLARHPHFLKPEALANAIHTIVSAPRGVHLNLVEVTPRPRWRTDDHRRSGQVSWLVPDDPHGAPPGAVHRPDRNCCTGCARSAATSAAFRLADRDVVMVSGAEANAAVLPSPGHDAGPGVRRTPS